MCMREIYDFLRLGYARVKNLRADFRWVWPSIANPYANSGQFANLRWLDLPVRLTKALRFELVRKQNEIREAPGEGEGGGGGFPPKILGGGVPPGSQNPAPFSDKKIFFFKPLFQTKKAKTIPYFRLKQLENHTLKCGTYPYSSYIGVPHSPPPWGEALSQFSCDDHDWQFWSTSKRKKAASKPMILTTESPRTWKSVLRCLNAGLGKIASVRAPLGRRYSVSQYKANFITEQNMLWKQCHQLP